MRAERIAGWTAAVAGVLFLVSLAAASFVPSVAGGATSGPGTTASCAGPGMMGMGTDHMGAGGMMGSMGGMMGGVTACTGMGSAPIAGALEVRVRATNFTFTPNEIRLPKGDAVNLTLENPATTGVVHDLTVPGLGVHVAASAGQTATVGLRALAAGRYDAYCSVPGHRDLGMRAVVIVE